MKIGTTFFSLTVFSFEQGFELNQKVLSKVHVIYKVTLAVNVLKWILILMRVSLGATSLWIMKQRMDMQSLYLPGIPKTVRGHTSGQCSKIVYR